MTKPDKLQYTASLQSAIKYWLESQGESLGLGENVVSNHVAAYMAVAAAGVLSLFWQEHGRHLTPHAPDNGDATAKNELSSSDGDTVIGESDTPSHCG